MKYLQAFILICFFSGCATLQPGADPLIVRVEQTQSVALTTLDGFLKFDLSTPGLPNSVHILADKVRATAPHALTLLDNARKTYESTKSQEAKTQLATALSVIEALLSEVNTANAANAK